MSQVKVDLNSPCSGRMEERKVTFMFGSPTRIELQTEMWAAEQNNLYWEKTRKLQPVSQNNLPLHYFFFYQFFFKVMYSILSTKTVTEGKYFVQEFGDNFNNNL